MSPRSQKHDDEGEEQPQKDHVVMKKLDDRQLSSENAKIIPDAGKVYLGTFLFLFWWLLLRTYLLLILVDFCSSYLLAIGGVLLVFFFFLNNLLLLVTTNSIYFLKPFFSSTTFSSAVLHDVLRNDSYWCRRSYYPFLHHQ